MNLRRFLLALVFISLCMALPLRRARAAAPETEIRIVVRNELQKPVPNAAVILDFLGGRTITRMGLKKPIHWEIHTNQEGLAHFPPISEGSIQLQVITRKYQTYGKKLEVEGKLKTLEITLHPPQDQYSAHTPLKPADPPR